MNKYQGIIAPRSYSAIQGFPTFSQAYKMELPPKIKYHPVLHVSLLKPYDGDQVDPSRGISLRAPLGMKIQHDKEVEEVLADRVVRHSNQPPTHELFVK